MEEYSGYVGLDVHKDTIAVAVAYPGRSKPESPGVIANTKKSIMNVIHRLSPEGEVVGFCYEAEPLLKIGDHILDTLDVFECLDIEQTQPECPIGGTRPAPPSKSSTQAAIDSYVVG